MEIKVPDYLEPIVAYRVWNLESDDSLRGYNNSLWEPYKAIEAKHVIVKRSFYIGTNIIERIELNHESPCDGPHPACGVYGLKTKEDLKRQLSALYFTNRTYVIGAVNLWGRIVEHERGYRAQYGYPKAFYFCNNYSDIKQLALKYGVPFEKDDSWKLDSPFDDLYQSHLLPLSQLGNQWLGLSRSQPVYQSLPKSKILLTGSWNPPIVRVERRKRKRIEIVQQSTLYKDKFINWHYDAKIGLHVRREPDVIYAKGS